MKTAPITASAWFLINTFVGALHMGEQLLTGLEEYDMFRRAAHNYHAMFAPHLVDHATVILITIIFATVSLLFFAISLGGKARLCVLGFFGLFGISEAHHLIEALATGGYDPGVITSVFYVIAGFYLLRSVWREWKGEAPALALRAA